MTRRTKNILVIVIAIILLGSATYLYITSPTGKKTIAPIIPNNPTSLPQPKPQTNVKPKATTIAHIFVIMDENQPASYIINNTYAPYINTLIKQSALATNYSGVTHPSLPNYLALTSGSTDGITTDCNPPSAGCIVNVKNIADLVAASGRTWKEYAESMPSSCYQYNAGNYATKHNPFVYYSDIVNNQQLCASHVVPYTQMLTDLKSASTTPNFAFITPNLCNDMHNCGIAAGDSWLSKNVPIILNSPAFTTTRSLLVITWDEGNASNNNVATIFAGSAAKSGFQTNQSFNHYSLLHTIENVWGLPNLTANDKNAPLMTSMLR